MTEMETALILAALNDEKKSEDERQLQAYNRLEMLRDNYWMQTRDRMAYYVSKDSLDILEKYINTSQNVYKRFLKRISRIYKKPPVRVFYKGGQVMTREQAADITAIYDEARVDLKMKTVNLFVNSVNTVFVRPVWRDGKLNLDVLTPDQVIVVTDPEDPTRMIAILIERKRVLPSGKSQRYWQVWTETEHFLRVEVGEYKTMNYGKVINTVDEPVPGNEAMVNPYGFIPFLPIHIGHLEAAFWDGTTGNDLYVANLVTAVRNTLLDFAAVWQSFKQIAVDTDGDVPNGLTLSPDSILHVKGGATFTSLDLTAAFDQIRGDLERYVRSVGQTYGISVESFNAPTQKSGVALKIESQELQDNWTDQVEIFRDAEQRLWKMIQRISEIEGHGVPLDVDIDVKFASMGMADEKTELENDQKKMELGLASPASVYMKYNDGIIDEAEAEAEMRYNLKLYKELTPKTDSLIMDIGMDTETEA
ncbi:MAG TPA: phage portal protein [Dissulfurispiraceae bacterium]|nr:phage portal protein [Dissulfurispiraceae bacterium]